MNTKSNGPKTYKKTCKQVPRLPNEACIFPYAFKYNYSSFKDVKNYFSTHGQDELTIPHRIRDILPKSYTRNQLNTTLRELLLFLHNIRSEKQFLKSSLHIFCVSE